MAVKYDPILDKLREDDTGSGSGDMSASTYDPQAIAGDAFDQDNMTDGTTNKNFTATEKTKLAGIEDGAEVNNISDANATDLTDTGDSTLHYHATDRARANHTGTQTASTISDFDTEVSNNTDVSANTSARHNALTVTDSSEIDFTLTGQDLTASIVAGSIDETKLDTSVNASLDLADSALQSNAVDSVNGQTGVVVLDQDDIGDGTTYKQYSSTEKTKLSNIEASADVTDAVNVGSSIHGATAKTTPVDADTMPLIDSAASNVLKKVTWANIKSVLTTAFNALYLPLSGGQLTGDLTVGSGSHDSTSALEVISTSKGFLPPRMTTAQRTGISSAATGLLVFDTDIQKLYSKDVASWRYLATDQNVASLSDDIATLSSSLSSYAYLLGRSGGQTLIGGTASGNNLALRSTSNATKGAVVLDSEELFTLGAGVRMVGYDLPTISNPSVLTVTFSYGTARVPFITEIYMTVGTSASVNRWGQYARRVVWRTPNTAGGSGIISSDNNLGTASGSDVTFSAPTATTNGFYFTMSTTTSSVLAGRNYMRVVMTGSAGLTVSAVVA